MNFKNSPLIFASFIIRNSKAQNLSSIYVVTKQYLRGSSGEQPEVTTPEVSSPEMALTESDVSHVIWKDHTWRHNLKYVLRMRNLYHSSSSSTKCSTVVQNVPLCMTGNDMLPDVTSSNVTWPQRSSFGWVVHMHNRKLRNVRPIEAFWSEMTSPVVLPPGKYASAHARSEVGGVL